MIHTQRSGLVQRMKAEVSHGLTRLHDVNGAEESGTLLVEAWRDDSSPVATTDTSKFWNGINCMGVVRNFGVFGPPTQQTIINYAQRMEDELAKLGIIR